MTVIFRSNDGETIRSIDEITADEDDLIRIQHFFTDIKEKFEERVHKENLRKNALAKLTDEERELLGDNNYPYF